MVADVVSPGQVGERGLRLDELPIDDAASTPSTSSASSTDADDLDASTTHAEDYDGSTPASKEARRAAGLSRSTRNVAVFVALKFKDREGGIIVGTTHLFWHPQHVSFGSLCVVAAISAMATAPLLPPSARRAARPSLDTQLRKLTFASDITGLRTSAPDRNPQARGEEV